jgi:hypothetical protein
MNQNREVTKSLIEERFETYVKGLVPDLSNFNSKHDGAEGDWLTKKMGLTVNGRNEPDFNGFEMKKDSRKTSFGDWAPDKALYKSERKGKKAELERSELKRLHSNIVSKKEFVPRWALVNEEDLYNALNGTYLGRSCELVDLNNTDENGNEIIASSATFTPVEE